MSPLRNDTHRRGGDAGKGSSPTNPPTGIALPLDQVEAIGCGGGRGLRGLPGRTPPCPCSRSMKNLLVVMTYSKSCPWPGPGWASPWAPDPDPGPGEAQELHQPLQRQPPHPEAGPGGGGFRRVLPGEGPGDHGHLRRPPRPPGPGLHPCRTPRPTSSS